MIQQFDCKEQDCDEVVEYKYEPIEGVVEITKFNIPKSKTEEAYLTCEKGHTHPYKVEVSK